MNRRSFLAALCVAPLVPVIAKAAAPAAAEAVKPPFLFQDGVLYLNDVHTGSLSELSATLGNVDISCAYIGNLHVGESNIHSPDFWVENRDDAMHLVYAEKFGIPATKFSR